MVPYIPVHKTERQEIVLTTLAATGSLSRSLKAASVPRQTHYWWLREDPDYKIRFSQAELRDLRPRRSLFPAVLALVDALAAGKTTAEAIDAFSKQADSPITITSRMLEELRKGERTSLDLASVLGLSNKECAARLSQLLHRGMIQIVGKRVYRSPLDDEPKAFRVYKAVPDGKKHGKSEA